MQLTLVSHYREKSPEFARLIGDLQQSLTQALGGGFVPYSIEQVHATLVGLEGIRIGGRIRNENFRQLRGEERCIDFEGLLNWLHSAAFPTFSVQVGGFKSREEYGFTSQGQHPFLRSFSIQNA